jgi:hypothetical protein
MGRPFYICTSQRLNLPRRFTQAIAGVSAYAQTCRIPSYWEEMTPTKSASQHPQGWREIFMADLAHWLLLLGNQSLQRSKCAV